MLPYQHNFLHQIVLILAISVLCTDTFTLFVQFSDSFLYSGNNSCIVNASCNVFVWGSPFALPTL